MRNIAILSLHIRLHETIEVFTVFATQDVVINSAPADIKLVTEQENDRVQDYLTSCMGYAWPKLYTKVRDRLLFLPEGAVATSKTPHKNTWSTPPPLCRN